MWRICVVSEKTGELGTLPALVPRSDAMHCVYVLNGSLAAGLFAVAVPFRLDVASSEAPDSEDTLAVGRLEANPRYNCFGGAGVLERAIWSIRNRLKALVMTTHEGDRKVLATLADYGADLTKPTHIIHYLYVPSSGAADEVATYLRSSGFDNVRAERSPPANLWRRIFGPKQFCCIAEQTAVPSEEKVFRTTDQLNALAAEHDGDYDGWEAAVEQ
ncbi:MAG: hypothetical protein Aurels2KO_56200 [Aureliella sp.]